MQESDTIVIYHGNCWDGFCASWLFHKVLPNAEYVPAQYGQAPPDVTGKFVYILDFSYKRPVMRQMLSSAKFVCVLDHHKTAEEELAGLVDEFSQRPDLIQNPPGSEVPFIRFDMNKSGGRLAWEYLCENITSIIERHQIYPEQKQSIKNVWLNHATHVLWLVTYTEDRDLWRWELPNSREINAYIRSYPLDFKRWDDWGDQAPAGSAWRAMCEAGAAILRREKQIVDDHVRNATEIRLAGHDVLCVNATVLFSDIAGELAKGRPFGVVYFDRKDGKRQWSLRSTDEGLDVSEIAKQFGGGGHRNAAGFETERCYPGS